jgi:hypothetical protein
VEDRIMNSITRSLVLALCATLALSAVAQVYKWTDKDGKVHYSSEAPPSGEAEAKTLKLDPGPTATNGTIDASATANAPAGAPATNADAKPNDDVTKQLAALDAQRCTAAKAVAARYETAPYLQKNGPDGKPQKLSIEEEAAERLKVKSDVEKLCKGK